MLVTLFEGVFGSDRSSPDRGWCRAMLPSHEAKLVGTARDGGSGGRTLASWRAAQSRMTK